ncbi:hypothetical protein CPC08DRAFT_770283 [Agrocybe pediades]|nr:hypothetical protein CPC08DRAFT_770283 [Agrocybe pediades]
MSIPSSQPLNVANDSLATFVKDLRTVLEHVQHAVTRLDSAFDARLGPSCGVEMPAGALPPSARPMDEIVPNSDDDFSDVESMANASSVADSLADKWYCVTVGRNPGVFHGPADVTPNITRIPGGLATKWKTRGEAEEAFFLAMGQGLVEKVSVAVVRCTLDASDRTLYHLP